MFAFGHTLFLTAALWHALPAEPACDDPVQATGSALLQPLSSSLTPREPTEVQAQEQPGFVSASWTKKG